MKQFTVIIEQIDQSKNLILEKSTASLRMALILLDNAAEILMYRKILSEFTNNQMYGKIRDKAKSVMPLDIFHKFLAEHSVPEILEEKKKKNILRYFDEKLSYLSDTCGLIPISVGAVLSSLHWYRNETYHRDIIRNEILRPIAILYFELVCELVIQLQQNHISHNSEDDWSQFFTKFGLGEAQFKRGILSDKDIEVLLNKFREELSINFYELSETLRKYVFIKLDETLDRLNFISDMLGNKSRNTTLKFIQFTKKNEYLPFNNRDLILQSKAFNEYAAPITVEIFSNWKTKAQHFVNLDDKLALFIAFKDLEDKFRPIEHRIYDVKGELDEAISLAIDLARGK